MSKIRCYTTYKSGAVDAAFATALFYTIEAEAVWKEAPRSKHGHTRQGHMLDVDSELGKIVSQVVDDALAKLTNQEYLIAGIYLNRYKDGTEWAPNHTHKGTHQMVISLGADRVLRVAKKEYTMKSGDAVLFGSAVHGVPPSDAAEPRISIATFMVPLTDEMKADILASAS